MNILNKQSFTINLSSDTGIINIKIDVDSMIKTQKVIDFYKEVNDLATAFFQQIANEENAIMVWLSDPGLYKISAIKTVRAFTDVGLREAKDLVESNPPVMLGSFSRVKALEFKKELEMAGCKAYVGSEKLKVML